jgi:hypothetical protein
MIRAKRERPDGEIGAPVVGRTSENSVSAVPRPTPVDRAGRVALTVLGLTVLFTFGPAMVAPICVAVGPDVLSMFAAASFVVAFLVRP